MMRRRSGFSLLEVVIAMTILSLALMGIGRFSATLHIRSRGNDLVAKRAAALQLEANKFAAVPYSTLSTWSTTDKTFTRGDFTYTRKLSISTASSTRYTIKVIVVPSTDATRKDSVMIDRTLPPTASPLCVGC